MCFEFCSWLPEELMMSWCLLLPAFLLPPITLGSPRLHEHCSTQSSASHHPQPADSSIWKSLRIMLEDKEIWLYPEFCHTSREKLFQAGSGTQLIAQMAASSRLCLVPFSLRQDCSVEAARKRPSCAFVAFPYLLDSFPYKNCSA